ncbi:Cytochrome P450 monooxygenase andK [Hyphodiscus hymeniophilus]|uniref:Cytochrome P450 monooxygenase andK n=1 Tax=Hyphodiscus hymeniophilus TaxID=353542 RepID=A0A9P6VI12_9HELO|nr:Cytochrome P450 monooxygenase andK [Hyphodiscus hymeniophilus]
MSPSTSNGVSHDIPPLEAPPLRIPPSTSTIRVQVIDTTTNLHCDAAAFIRPIIPGHEKLNLPTMCFLLENKAQNKFILFDGGARKDFWNGPPKTKLMIGGHTEGVKIEKGVDEVLVDSGFDLAKLAFGGKIILTLNEQDAIVWSHWHWDHTGDASKFHPHTDVVVGPGFTEEGYGKGYPKNPEGVLLESDLAGRNLNEISFSDDFKIGNFRAHDFFGDGSFYLLDTPGHATGHMCGLARTTPSTFALLGGDCCHFVGVFRPTAYIPLPGTVPASNLDSSLPNPCPCSIFTQYHPLHNKDDSLDTVARTTPFYKISREKENVYSFPELAEKSIDSLQPFDADPNVIICMAHDGELFRALPLLNRDPGSDINDWKVKGYKEHTHWGFLNELPRDGKPGREPLVQGVNRDGKKLKLGPDLVFRDAE